MFLKHTLNRCIRYGIITKEATFQKYDGIVSTQEDFLLFITELHSKFQQTLAKTRPLNLDFHLLKNF